LRGRRGARITQEGSKWTREGPFHVKAEPDPGSPDRETLLAELGPLNPGVVPAGGLAAGTAEKLKSLAERYHLSEHQRTLLAAILLAVVADKRSPTAVRDPMRLADVHLADSLVALEMEAIGGARKIADLGAGAGFPGLALAVALPEAEVRLVESQARRCTFIEGLRVKVGIANARAICSRIEEWVDGVQTSDVVLARALAAPAVVVEYAAPLLRVGGTLIEWRGRREPEAERLGRNAASQVGLELAEVRHVEPYEGARDHHLHIYVKRQETPSRFPRRAGMARKRPLGG
jgi:16S rRNA (guanine527-N7)-methyltransferase